MKDRQSAEEKSENVFTIFSVIFSTLCTFHEVSTTSEGRVGLHVRKQDTAKIFVHTFQMILGKKNLKKIV